MEIDGGRSSQVTSACQAPPAVYFEFAVVLMSRIAGSLPRSLRCVVFQRVDVQFAEQRAKGLVLFLADVLVVECQDVMRKKSPLHFGDLFVHERL